MESPSMIQNGHVIGCSISDVTSLANSTTDLLPESSEVELQYVNMPQIDETPVMEEEQVEHRIMINDWDWNQKQTKKWYSLPVKRFPSNQIRTTKVCV